MELTEEQKCRMEQSRLAAIARRDAKTSNSSGSTPNERSVQPSPSCSRTSNIREEINQNACRNLQTTVGSGLVQSQSYPSVNASSSSPAKARSPYKSPKKHLTGSCVLMNTVTGNARFKVDIGFHESLLKIFKTMPSSEYDGRGRRWNFSIADHDILMNEVAKLQDVTIYPLRRADILRCMAEIQEENELQFSKLDPVLKKALYPFQEEGIRFGIKKNGRLLIADDMGLGKTIQAMGIASIYKEKWPLLIVCPSSLKYTWLQAFLVWLPSLDPKTISVVATSKEELNSNETKVYIMSYTMLIRRREEFFSKKIDVAVLDESHFIKNRKTLRAEAVEYVLKDASHVILLSGTPAVSRPMDLYTQLHLIDPNKFHSAGSFARRYCYGHTSHSGHWRENGACNEKELSAKLQKWVMIRRLKSDVLPELPPKQRQKIRLNPYAVNHNCAILEMFRRRINIGSVMKREDMFTYYSETAKAKLPAVRKYVADLLESEDKFLVFAHHKIVLNGICKTLTKKNINFIRIEGSTEAKERSELCTRFQQNQDCRVAVLSITTAHTGITLTSSRVAVFAELFWNPALLIQAEDRVHRIGQTGPVLIQYLVAEDTADDIFWDLITGKNKVLRRLGLSEERFTNLETIDMQAVWGPVDDDSDDDEDDAIAVDTNEPQDESDADSVCLDEEFVPPLCSDKDDESDSDVTDFDNNLEDEVAMLQENAGVSPDPEDLIEDDDDELILEDDDDSGKESEEEEDFDYQPDVGGKVQGPLVKKELEEIRNSSPRKSARISERKRQCSDSDDDNDVANERIVRPKVSENGDSKPTPMKSKLQQLVAKRQKKSGMAPHSVTSSENESCDSIEDEDSQNADEETNDNDKDDDIKGVFDSSEGRNDSEEIKMCNSARKRIKMIIESDDDS